MTVRTTAALTLALGLLLLPGAAEACSVCFSSDESSRVTYKITAALLTLLPFALIGGTALVLWRRARKLARADAP